MSHTKKTDKEAKEAKEITDKYLQNKYSNQEVIQIFTDGARYKDGIVAAANVQTYPESRKMG
jgi:hypothetical protein